jgi:hypothetical protein
MKSSKTTGEGLSPFPLRHLSIRVPWHDGGWNGTVCQNPAANTSCLVLKSIGQKRRDADEVAVRGNAVWRLGVQRHVLRRHAKPGDRVIGQWIDEFQNHAFSGDTRYLAECRSHFGCQVVLTQSLHAFYAAIKGGRSGEHLADALLTNYGTKCFCALGDAKTAEYASSLVGKSLQTFIGGSMAPQADLYDELMGRSKFTGTFSEHYENILQPNAFMTGLRTGGAENGYVVDAMVIRSGGDVLERIELASRCVRAEVGDDYGEPPLAFSLDGSPTTSSDSAEHIL